jgi:hypothetical protein
VHPASLIFSQPVGGSAHGGALPPDTHRPDIRAYTQSQRALERHQVVAVGYLVVEEREPEAVDPAGGEPLVEGSLQGRQVGAGVVAQADNRQQVRRPVLRPVQDLFGVAVLDNAQARHAFQSGVARMVSRRQAALPKGCNARAGTRFPRPSELGHSARLYLSADGPGSALTLR